MFIPIRKRAGLGQTLIAGAVGGVISLYVWTPFIREQLEKEKKAKLSIEADPKT